MQRSIAIVLIAGIFLVFSNNLNASVRENQFGAGAVSSALAGTGIANISGGAATYLNPANLARCQRSGFDLGLKYLSTHFKQNGSQQKIEQAQSVLVAELGGCLVPIQGLGLGVWTSNGLLQPITLKLATARDDIIFQRFNRHLNAPTLMVGVGYGFIPQFSLGLGFSVTMQTLILQNVYAPLSGSSTPFFAELEARVRPRAAIVAGLSVQPWDFIGFGATFRSASFGQVDVDADTQAAAFGYDAPPIQVLLSESLEYAPRQYAVGIVWTPLKSVKIMADVNYALWSRHPKPFLLAAPKLNSRFSSGIPFEPIEEFSFKDVFIPKLGVEWTLAQKFPLRIGYGFHPAVIGLPSKGTNVVDGSTHNISMGAGFRSQNDFMAFHTDIFVAASIMPENGVIKNATNGTEKYTFGGIAISTGLSAGLDF